jgi:hypothetical protein
MIDVKCAARTAKAGHFFPHDEPADCLHDVATLNHSSLVSAVFRVVMIFCTAVMRLTKSQSVLLLQGAEKLNSANAVEGRPHTG